MSRIMSFVVFIAVVLTIYFFANYYIIRHISGSMAPDWPPRRMIRFGLLFFILAFPVARTWMSFFPSRMADSLYYLGSLWMAAMLYLVIGFLLFDLLRGAFHLIPSLKGVLAQQALKGYITAGIAGATLLLLIAGTINAANQRIHRIELHTDKTSRHASLRIAMVSDIHLGSIIGKASVRRLVRMINGENPDLVIFAGDVFDDNAPEVIRQGLAAGLKDIRAKYGMIGVTGNHEYFSKVDLAVDHLNDLGIQILRDTVLHHESGITIAGREDRDAGRIITGKRKSVARLLEGVDTASPVLVIDHQPYDLADKAAAGADLNLSGHTHDGQLWPFGYVAKAIFGVGTGYTAINGMHNIVSTGFGSWGPPVRLGNRPEVVVINWHFRKP